MMAASRASAAAAQVSVLQFSAKHIEKCVPPTTPRSLAACRQEGVDPGELRYAPRRVFETVEREHQRQLHSDVAVSEADFAGRVDLRHAAHVRHLKRDLSRVQRRWKANKKRYFRRKEAAAHITKKHAAHQLRGTPARSIFAGTTNTGPRSPRKSPNQRHRAAARAARNAAAAEETRKEERIGATLGQLGISLTDAPQWLDLDGDGDISLAELAPLEDMMGRMVVEKKRQERSLKIKLTTELNKVKMERRLAREQEKNEGRRQKQARLELAKRRREQAARAEDEAEARRAAAEQQAEEERRVRRKILAEHRKKKHHEETVRLTAAQRHRQMQMQIEMRRTETEARLAARERVEALAAAEKARKWDEEGRRLERDLKATEARRKAQAEERAEQQAAWRQRRAEEEAKMRSKTTQIEDSIEILQATHRARAQKRRKKRLAKIAVRKELNEEKTEAAFAQIARAERAKNQRFQQKQRKLAERQAARAHEEGVLLERRKLHKNLLYSKAGENVERMQQVKNRQNDHLHARAAGKHERIARLEAQRRGVREHGRQLRERMYHRKKEILRVVHRATQDDDWEDAEKLLRSMVQGHHAVAGGGSSVTRTAVTVKATTMTTSMMTMRLRQTMKPTRVVASPVARGSQRG